MVATCRRYPCRLYFLCRFKFCKTRPFQTLFAVLLLPIFSKMLNLKESIGKLVKLSASIIISGSLVIAISSFFFAEEIMNLMYTINTGETEAHFILRIAQSAKIFRLLMFSFVAISSNYIFGTLLTANNSLKQLNLIAGGGLIINLSLNLILIPQFQSVGSAYASLATQSITAILQLYIVTKIFKFNINYKLISNLILLVLLLLAEGYLLVEFSTIRWEFLLIIMLVTGLLFTIILKLVNIREFIVIIKDEN